MKPILVSFFLGALGMIGSGCIGPTRAVPYSNIPGTPESDKPRGGVNDPWLAGAAALSQLPGQNKPQPLAPREVTFKCEVFLKNEPVSNVRLCHGIAFLILDGNGKTLSRLYPNEKGVFRFLGEKDHSYRVTVEKTKQWKIEEEGPFFTEREYKLTLREI